MGEMTFYFMNEHGIIEKAKIIWQIYINEIGFIHVLRGLKGMVFDCIVNMLKFIYLQKNESGNKERNLPGIKNSNRLF